METIDEHGAGTISSMASLGLHLATRATPAARGRAVRGRDQLLEALDRGAVTVDDTVRVAGWTTTVGRHLVAACLPPEVRDVAESPWTAVRGVRAIARITRELHVEIAARCVAALEVLGRQLAQRSGLSIALDDLLPPPEARAVVADASNEAARLQADYRDGLITDGELFNRQVDLWAGATDLARLHARRAASERDPLAACAASQAEPVAPDVVRSMIGAMITSSGSSALALTGTLAEGLGPHEYFFRADHRRRSALDLAERQRVADEMFAELDVVLGDLEIVAVDCQTTRGMRVRAIVYDDASSGSLARVIAGSVTAEDVTDRDGAVIAPLGTLLEPALARRIEAAQVTSVLLRDVRTCEATGGVCARCFGLSPEDALWTGVGDDVGARAASAIASAMRQLSPRRITHIC